MSAALDNILEKLGGLEKYIAKGDRGFIKTNMFIDDTPESGLDEAIIDLSRIIKVNLIITDAIYSLWGSFPANGWSPLKTDFIMAFSSRDVRP